MFSHNEWIETRKIFKCLFYLQISKKFVSMEHINNALMH